ncbi:hypothetical protein [Rathayibacter tritici]|uniref:Peptidoglycan-binding protein n=1 Tax=Rathayibacter tritici TaxID=33888 RepID=A0A160KUN9_9MICO|nr:hypothetical protein [Rathayibacter tritici]AND17383.1 peptidoglycan-binding protein [Rathayibacter tritici]PPI50141.1 hypothetical protein C5D18_00090 [Rathayibacter tritici]
MSTADTDEGPTLRLRPRPWVIVVVLVPVIGAMAAAFLLGQALRAPDATAFGNAQRTLTTTGTVEKRTLPLPSALGTVGGSTAVSVQAVAPSGAAAAQITAAPLGVGSAVVDGALLFAVAERPVFALAIDGPHYRDLAQGDEGEDVLALNGALAGLGYAADSEEDTYDSATVASLAAFYEDRGYRAQRGPDVVSAAPASALPSAAPSGTQPTPAPTTTVLGPRGGRLPFSEIVDLDRSDFTVATAPSLYSVIPGDGTVMTWTVPPDRVIARVDVASADSLAVGAAASIVDPASTKHATGTIESIGPFKPAVDKSAPGHDVTVLVSAETRTSLAAGSSVTVTFGDRGAERIAVPATALRQDGATSFVDVDRPDGRQRVDIEVRVVADGWALLDGEPALSVGDTVVIG